MSWEQALLRTFRRAEDESRDTRAAHVVVCGNLGLVLRDRSQSVKQILGHWSVGVIVHGDCRSPMLHRILRLCIHLITHTSHTSVLRQHLHSPLTSHYLLTHLSPSDLWASFTSLPFVFALPSHCPSVQGRSQGGLGGLGPPRVKMPKKN